MSDRPLPQHHVAVVRVELVDAAAGRLIVDLLEVSRSGDSDRVLGRAFEAAGGARLLYRWLQEIGNRGRGGAVTIARRTRDRAPVNLPDDSREEM